MRHLAVLVLACLTSTLAAQDTAPAFEVVSVKPNTAIGRPGMISAPTGSQFRVENVALRGIINYAYNLREIELADAPDWASAERFDIMAHRAFRDERAIRTGSPAPRLPPRQSAQ